MQVIFYNETRKAFDTMTTGSEIVGAFVASEVQYTMSWQEATAVDVTFTASPQWVKNNLMESPSPARKSTARARYLVVVNPFGEFEPFVLTGMTASTGDSLGLWTVSVSAADPRVWMDQYPQPAPAQKGYKDSHMGHLTRVSRSLSATSFGFEDPAKRLPIAPLSESRSVSESEARMGVINPSDDVIVTAPKEARRVEYDAPLPIGPAYDAILEQYGDGYELFPIGTVTATGPRWAWVLRKSWVNNTKLLTVAEGDITISSFSQDLTASEALVYGESDGSFYYSYPSKENVVFGMNGPWLGVTTEQITPSFEDDDIEKTIERRAQTKSARARLRKEYAKEKTRKQRRLMDRQSRRDSGAPRRTEVSAELNTNRLGEFLMPGVTLIVDAGDIKFRFRVSEVDYGWSADGGWRMTGAS